MRTASQELSLESTHYLVYLKKALPAPLPVWLWQLLPTQARVRTQQEPLNFNQILLAAATRGALHHKQGKLKLLVGQVSISRPAMTITLRIRKSREAKLFAEFADSLCLSKISSVIRTAIMAGLKLPRIELGVMSQTRYEPFTNEEMCDLWDDVYGFAQ